MSPGSDLPKVHSISWPSETPLFVHDPHATEFDRLKDSSSAVRLTSPEASRFVVLDVLRSIEAHQNRMDEIVATVLSLIGAMIWASFILYMLGVFGGQKTSNKPRWPAKGTKSL
jgi:hypothetical protein